MSEQPNPQPNPQTIIRVQSQEINRLNDNRLYLIALLEDTKAEALAEIGKRDGEIEALKAQIDSALNDE
jgi:hypothetical protein